jgi:serine/threonine-protein kinase
MGDPSLERRALALFEAMLAVPEAGRDAWLAEQAGGEPELLARVQAIVRADRLAALRTGAAVEAVGEAAAPERIGAYRITGLIGHGGMGSVYRGERATGDFAHAVAIKIVKPGLLSQALVERFQRERQTLAGLAHPNIAQLYDGGATDDGSPYIVMELVDGLPLLQWAEERRAGPRERQRLFRDICAAVSFAHRNLVVHRDLTPSNVLVASDGTVKLIDFGIARPADRQARDAATGGAVAGASGSLSNLSLTPGYAAPERMVSGEVTTAADIYSLGRLLERLIPPGRDDADLRAIIARATAEAPQDRYATVDALDADLAAWADGRPVAAMGRGRAYVARKFVTRHRGPVAAGAAAIVLLVAALVVTLLASERASAARREAERRFTETRSIARTLLFDTYDEVSKAPGSTLAREQLARTGLRYLDALAAGSDAPLDVRVEAGRGFVRLAEVTGSGKESQLGKFDETRRLLARAEAILKPAFTAHPADPGVRRAWAALLVEQAGTNLINENRPDLAERQARQARELLRADAARDPAAAREYLAAVVNEGDAHLWRDGYAKARAILAEGEAFAEGLPEAIRRDPRVLAARAVNQRQFGEALHKLRQVAPTRAMLDRSVETARLAVAADPLSPGITRTLISTLWYRAVVHRTNYRDPEAQASIEEALALARRQQERDPADVGAMKMFALVGEVHAQVSADRKRFAESHAMGREVIAAHRRMVELAGDAPGALRSMNAALATYGGNFHTAGDYAEACRVWRQVIDNWELLDRRGQLTKTDRDRGLPEVQGYWTKSCANGPPRRIEGW